MAFKEEQPTRPHYNSKWLFHQQGFYLGEGNFRTYYQYSQDSVLARLRCQIDDHIARAAPEGPYGCLELEPLADVNKFLEYVREDLLSRDVKQLSITLYPENFNKDSFARQKEAFQQLDFKMEGTIIHKLIPVTNEENEQLANNDWRNSANTITEFRVTQEPLDSYEKILHLMGHHGDEVSSAEQKIQGLRSRFPEETLLFAARDGAKYCAYAVAVRLSKEIVYIQHLDQLGEYHDSKPLIALFQFLYEWCELRDVRYIDMGDASFNHQNTIGTIPGTAERWVAKWG